METKYWLEITFKMLSFNMRTRIGFAQLNPTTIFNFKFTVIEKPLQSKQVVSSLVVVIK